MAKTFTSVSRDELQQAFGLAHRLGQSEDVPPELRRRFEEIARLIWKAHGEEGSLPAELPDGYPGRLDPGVSTPGRLYAGANEDPRGLRMHRDAFALVYPPAGGARPGKCTCGATLQFLRTEPGTFPPSPDSRDIYQCVNSRCKLYGKTVAIAVLPASPAGPC